MNAKSMFGSLALQMQMAWDGLALFEPREGAEDYEVSAIQSARDCLEIAARSLLNAKYLHDQKMYRQARMELYWAASYFRCAVQARQDYDTWIDTRLMYLAERAARAA